MSSSERFYPFDQDSFRESELNLFNVCICLGISFSLLLGCFCLVSHPEVIDSQSSVFLFIAFYMCVELTSAAFAALVLSFLLLGSWLSGREIDWRDLCGLFAVCTYSVSYLAHMLAIVVGPVTYFAGEKPALLCKVFILYQILFGVLILARMVYLFATRQNKERFFPEVDQLTHAQIQHAQQEIEMARRTQKRLGSDDRRGSNLSETPAAPLDSFNT